MRVLLASTSPARLMLLRQTAIEPLLQAPHVDEDAAVVVEAERLGRSLTPPEYVQFLATVKAEAVLASLADTHPGFTGVLIGGDSMFELDGEVQGKPHRPDVAAERWRRMRGRTGVLHSGHAVIRVQDGVRLGATGAAAAASVRFAADITDAEIDAYVASGEPLEVAGAFTLDSLGAGFIERIEGDPSTVVGMSLPILRRLIRELGVEWTDLWAQR